MKTNHSGWLQASRATAFFCAGFIAALAHASTVATPAFSPGAGTYTSAQSVKITSTTGSATIRFTTDGSTPSTTTGTIYPGPVSIRATTTLKAIAYKAGSNNSAVASGTYTIKAVAPTFSPAAGTYTSIQSVTIASTTSGATIRYTTDGSTPSATAGTLYSSPVVIGVTTTLKAIAYETGLTNSAVASGTYTINLPTAATPTFSPATGTYTSMPSVTITSTTGGATIRYTTDGSTPSATAGTIYSIPVSIGTTTTLKAIAYKTGFKNSAVKSGTYTINLSTAAAPIFSPAAGTFTSGQTVTVTTTTGGASIRYTTDGSTPSATAGTLYSGPISISATTTLEAIAFKANFNNSTVTNGLYTINIPPPSTPVFSPSGGSFTSGQSVTITSLGADSIYYTTDGTAPTTSSTLYTGAVTVSNNTTLQAIGTNAGGSSPAGTASFTILPPAPVCSPAPGTYTNVTTFSVTVSDAASATIYYTTDGSTPTAASTQYTAPVSLPVGTTTLSAIAVNANGSSAVASGVYILTPPPPQTPVSSPAGGSFTNSQSVTITSLGADSIYYTTDGTTPTTASILYTGAVTISNNTVLQAIGVNTGGSSPVGTASFTILPPAPAFNPAPGTYTNVTTFSVTITNTASFTIYYTTDGTTPTAASTQYTAPVSLPIGTTTLNAIAVTANGSSAVASGTYILTPPPPQTPVSSPAGGSFTNGQSVTITSLGADSIYYTTDGTTPTTASILYTGAVTVSNNTVLQAIGVNAGGSSPVGTASFTILPPAPVFNPAPGTYANVTTFSVTVSDAASATIYYTTDGTTPTAASTQYTAPVLLQIGTTTLSAIAVNANGSSAVASGVYILTPPPPQTPVSSPAGGSFTNSQSVTITSLGADSIYYTTDGTTPTTASILYTGAVTVSNNTVLQAIGVNSGGNSPVGTASFTILPPAPVFNPAPGTYTNVTTFSVTVSDAASATIYYTTDGTTPTAASTQYTAPVLLQIGTTTLSAIAVNANGSSAVASGAYIITPPPPSTPVFSPSGGSFTNGQSVTITSLGADSIYYTTDGTTPTTASILYTGAVTVSNNTVLQAIGVNSGGNSPVGTASFTILPPAAAPVFSPAGGTYSSNQSVTIASASSFASIRYTTDGSTPTETNGTVYNGPVMISGVTTLQAIAYGPAFTDSAVTSATYTITPLPAPTFNTPGGFYPNVLYVTISDSVTTPVAPQIRYTIDGSTPTETHGTVYSSPVYINGIVTLQAIAYGPAFTDSPVASATYMIGPRAIAPTFNPGSGTFTSAQAISMTTTTSGATIYYTTDGSTPTEANGLRYIGPVYINNGTNTLKAIANANGFFDSAVTSGTYTISISPTFNVLYNFALSNNGGTDPWASLVQGSDGNFYGTAKVGGSSNDGTVFRITPAGVFTPLVTFTGANGAVPVGALVQGSDGNFYGTTTIGGSANDGTVFKMTPAGVLTTLVTFTGATNGANPYASLMQGSDGNFYGTTSSGGSANDGTAFRMTPAGVLTTLVTFTGANGANPYASLVQGSDGNFYGAAQSGGSNGYGTVFKMTPAGVLTTLFSFNFSNGAYPDAMQIINGNFYGSTFGGGSGNAGTIFTITPTGVLTTLFTFTGIGTSGANPYGQLVPGGGGYIYGTTSGGGGGGNDGTIFELSPAGVLTTVFTFTGPNGIAPRSGLVQGNDGKLYGTTAQGGTSNTGVVFQFTVPPIPASPTFSPAAGTYAGAQTVTISTTISGASIRYTIDGSTPTETNGSLYSGVVSINGTTRLRAIAYGSGINDSPVADGLYSITASPGGSFDVLYNFAPQFGDAPEGTLTQGSDGNFYGTTSQGDGSSDGNVFRVTPNGLLTILVTFNGANGAAPDAGLVQGSDGNFYGTTLSGGSLNDGTVFKMTPSGALTTLVSFTGTNGVGPLAGLVQGGDGNFYGTTARGGSNNLGTVFKMTPSGALTTLVSFTGANGSQPYAGLVQGSDGNFYGTTYLGGSGTEGTVFKMTPAGVLATLVSFNGSNGANPKSAVVQGSDGNFYGTTYGGGIVNDGTVFKMTPAGVLTTLASFAGGYGGANPYAALVQGSDGSFYGTAAGGGGGNSATIFRIAPPGALTTLAFFDSANGANPYGGLMQGSDGSLYGLTQAGGVAADGVFFKFIPPPPQVIAPVFSPAAGTYTIAQTVTITSATPGASIRYTTNGITPTESYGTLYSGAVNVGATTTLMAIAYETGFPDSTVTSGVYTINLPPAAAPVFSPATGTYASAQVISITTITNGATIRYTIDGSTPTETNGTIYSGPVTINTTTRLKAMAYEPGIASDSPVTSGLYTITSSPAVTLSTFYNFAYSSPSIIGGVYPQSALLQASDGNFYGTTLSGGTASDGTVYKVTPSGVLTSLVSFTGANGANPYAGLVQGSDGNFYGTTEEGGSGSGNVFKLTPAGVLTSLVSFGGANGARPLGTLVLGSDGNFYGATNGGGSVSLGTVFKVTSTGTLTSLVSFTGPNGSQPDAGLARGSDGNFYGTTYSGGSANQGTVFVMTPAGVLTTLVTFNFANGANPAAALFQASDGNFYGTTLSGGTASDGTVYKVTPAGVLTTLVSFTGANGASPYAGLVQGSDGNFYGTTYSGGSGDQGTVFEMTPAGVLTTLASFDLYNGANPFASLVQGSDGNFYGTTTNGGSSNQGVVFQLILPH